MQVKNHFGEELCSRRVVRVNRNTKQHISLCKPKLKMASENCSIAKTKILIEIRRKKTIFQSFVFCIFLVCKISSFHFIVLRDFCLVLTKESAK